MVLLPLLAITVTLLTFEAMGRIADTRAMVDQQRETLIDSRKQGVRQVVETARTAIMPIVEQAGHNDDEAKERAAEMLRSIRFDGENYVFAYQYDATNLVLPHAREREGTNFSEVTSADGAHVIVDMIDIAKRGGGFYQYPWEYPGTDDLELKYSYAVGIPEWEWMLGSGVYVKDIDEAMAEIEAAAATELHKSLLSTSLVGGVIFLIVAILAWSLVRRILGPIRRTAAAMQDIAQGKGDLTRRLEVESDDEIGNLATQFNAFASRMQDTLREVRTSTGSVYHSSGEIAQGSEELASRTEQAAANLQETSASMEEITSTVTHSAESAQQANQLVQSTAEVARQGEAAMSQVEHTMDDINASASKISDIISMIDAIAFQTNILALNASVEAARAGEHGRGFAVVAQEVRTLASRSSEASREIRELIDTSVSHTQAGAELVRGAGDTMREIVASVARVTDVISEISAAAKEQSSGIGQVNAAVTEMDTMTQQNAAMVQQSKTAAADLRHHAECLNELINTFVLGEDSTARQSPSTARLTHQASRSPAEALPSATRRAPVKRSEHEAVGEWETF